MWKLSLTSTPDPTRPTRRGPDHNRPTTRALIGYTPQTYCDRHSALSKTHYQHVSTPITAYTSCSSAIAIFLSFWHPGLRRVSSRAERVVSSHRVYIITNASPSRCRHIRRAFWYRVIIRTPALYTAGHKTCHFYYVLRQLQQKCRPSLTILSLLCSAINSTGSWMWKLLVHSRVLRCICSVYYYFKLFMRCIG